MASSCIHRPHNLTASSVSCWGEGREGRGGRRRGGRAGRGGEGGGGEEEGGREGRGDSSMISQIFAVHIYT